MITIRPRSVAKLAQSAGDQPAVLKIVGHDLVIGSHCCSSGFWPFQVIQPIDTNFEKQDVQTLRLIDDVTRECLRYIILLEYAYRGEEMLR